METLSLLFVDDDPLFLDLISLLAADVFPGAQIVTLEHPNFVRAACERQHFDCVLLDYRMPTLNGVACAKGLHRILPYLPIILVTGSGDEVLAASAIHAGVTDYIPKSRLKAQSLRRTINNAIQITGQRRVIDEQRAELETFAHALAHDFKQPLRQITTFTQMISDELGDSKGQDVATHMAFVDTAARRLANLVDVMSDYTLLGRPVPITNLKLQDVVTDVSAALSCYIEERAGRIVSDVGQNIRGNATLMAQVLQNLIVNGLKYNTSSCPTVWISAAYVDEGVEILVRDNGIGIERQYHEAVFAPLVRLHSEAAYAGTGLGLTMVRKALARQEGVITCSSEPGQGTEFCITLAAARAGRRRAAA